MTGFAGSQQWLLSTAWLWSHVSFGLLAAAVTVQLLDRCDDSSLQRPKLAGRAFRGGTLFLIGVAAGLIPVRFTDAAGYLVAFSGELSFATLFYLGLVTFSGRVGRETCELRSGIAPRIAWIAGGIAVYTSALSGRGPDVYAWGFSAAAEGVVLALSAAAFATGRRLTAAMLLGVVLARQMELGGSGNLWDYAIDPFLVAGSAGYLLWVAVARGHVRHGQTVQDLGDATGVDSSGTAESPRRTIAC